MHKVCYVYSYMSKIHNCNNRLTTVSLSQTNYQKLKHMGYATESINDVLNRLLANYTLEAED